MKNRFIAYLTSVLFLIQQTIAFSAPTSQETHSDVHDQFNELAALAEELRTTIDRREFDLSVLLDVLDYDAERIIEYVTKSIRFEQYSGVLRGARGTLMAGAGNSFDQSMLLATLLKDAGYEARILRGKLSAAQAKQLVSGIGQQPHRMPPPLDLTRVKAIFNKYAPDFNVSSEDIEISIEALSKDKFSGASEYQRRADSETAFIRGLLDKQGIVLGHKAEEIALTEEAQDYSWVEFKTDATTDWVSMHPTFPADTSLSELQPSEIYASAIPPEMQHRVRIQFFLERSIGGEVEQVEISEPWERPAANLGALPIAFSGMSAALTRAAGATRNEPAVLTVPEDGNDIFVLTFNGQPLDKAFDLQGNLVPLADASSSFAGVFATVSNQLNIGAGAISSLGKEQKPGDPKGLVSLHSLKVVYTFIAPDGEHSRHVRYIYDGSIARALPEAEKKAHAYKSLTRRYSFMVSTGSVPESYVADQQLSSILRANELAESMLEYEKSGNVPKIENLHADWEGFVTLYNSFQNSGKNYLAYTHKPSLVAHHQTLPFGNVVTEGIDIVRAPSRAFILDNDTLRLSAPSRLEQGVWESIVESAILDQLGPTRAQDTYSAFQDARESNSEFMTLTTKDIERALEFPIQVTTRTYIVDDLRAGNVVILPKAWEQDNRVAWWSVNPKTGETLGRSTNGEGAITLEYKIKLILLAGFSGFVLAWSKCQLKEYETSGPGVYKKCIICGLFAGVTAALVVWVGVPTAGGAQLVAFLGLTQQAINLKSAYVVFMAIIGSWILAACS